MNLTNTLTLTPSIAIDIEAGNDIEHMINDVSIEATTKNSITNKMSVKKRKPSLCTGVPYYSSRRQN